MTTSLDVLTDEQRETYARDGYLVLPALYRPDETAAMAAESDRLVDLLVNASLATGEVSPRIDLRSRPEGPVLLKVQPLADVSPLLKQVSEDDRLLQPMRDLLGCEPLMLEEKLNGKELLALTSEDLGDLPVRPSSDAFPFHTDYHYFYLDGYPPETLSSAIAIDACTRENGALRVVPGSHLQEWPLASTWPPYLDEASFPDEDQVYLECPAGTVVLFHSKLAHASSPNTTPEPRRLLIYSHYPATYDVEPDARNRPLREQSAAHEERYAEALAAGYSPVPVRR
jgi:ectoine hydroxylase